MTSSRIIGLKHKQPSPFGGRPYASLLENDVFFQGGGSHLLGKIEKWTDLKFKSGLLGTRIAGRQQSASSGSPTKS